MINKIPDIKNIVAKNLIKYRKIANLTQQQLAEKINYTDKAISKWERGEGLPDIYVLKQIADVYNIEVEALLHQESPLEKIQNLSRNKAIIATLSILLVWLLAMVIYAMFEIFWPKTYPSYLTFIAAIPASFIVATVFNNIWGSRIYNMVLVSGINWGSSSTIVLSLVNLVDNIWYLFFVSAVLEVMIVIWYLLDIGKKDKSHHHIVNKED